MKFSTIILTTLLIFLAISCGEDSIDFYISSNSISFTKNYDIERRTGIRLNDEDGEIADIDVKKVSVDLTLFKKELGQDKVKIFEKKDYRFKLAILNFNVGEKELIFLIKNKNIEYDDNIEYYEVKTKVTYKKTTYEGYKVFSDESIMRINLNN